MSYFVDKNGQCPHCGRVVRFIHSESRNLQNEIVSTAPKSLIASGGSESIVIYSSKCPSEECGKPIAELLYHSFDTGEQFERLVHPYYFQRYVPPETPTHIAEDFKEAVSVLSISKKASAALSRRCLELILKDQKIPGKDLNEKIENVILTLPSEIAENVDAVRHIGNYAAHETKSKSTGLIVEVEPHEAEWNLEVIEDLMDHYYVKPKKAAKRREELNKKLADAGKPQLKKP